GTTEIADRVVQKIAAAAIGEISEIGGPVPRVLGVAVGSEDPDHRPQVTATVHGTDVDLAVRASVHHPAPIADVVGRARSRAAARIAQATGLQVRHLDVTVTALSTDPAPAGRTVR
ncbi:MAG: Asp23/Gls24 family envelope stress response protein, partial [Pseudonocardia sediminis]